MATKHFASFNRVHSSLPAKQKIIPAAPDLLSWLELHFHQLLHFPSKHSLGLRCAVDTAGLDTDHVVTAVLQEVLSVEAHNTSLVRLSNICKHHVHHGDQHPVLLRVPRILNYGNDIWPLLRHIDQVAAAAVAELNRINSTFRANQVAAVTDRCAAGSTQVQQL